MNSSDSQLRRKLGNSFYLSSANYRVFVFCISATVIIAPATTRENIEDEEFPAKVSRNLHYSLSRFGGQNHLHNETLETSGAVKL